MTADVVKCFTEPNSDVPVDALRDLARSLLRLSTTNKLEAIEDALIAEAMALAKGNKSAAARLLGVHRKTLDRRLDKRPEPESTDPGSEPQTAEIDRPEGG